MNCGRTVNVYFSAIPAAPEAKAAYQYETWTSSLTLKPAFNSWFRAWLIARSAKKRPVAEYQPTVRKKVSAAFTIQEQLEELTPVAHPERAKAKEEKSLKMPVWASEGQNHHEEVYGERLHHVSFSWICD